MPDQTIEFGEDCPQLIITHVSPQVPEADRRIPYTKADPNALVKVEAEYKSGLNPGDAVSVWGELTPGSPHLQETTDWDALSDLQSSGEEFTFTGTPPQLVYSQGYGPELICGGVPYPLTTAQDGEYIEFYSTAGLVGVTLNTETSNLSMSYLKTHRFWIEGYYTDVTGFTLPEYRSEEEWDEYSTTVTRSLSWYYGDGDANPLGEPHTKITIYERLEESDPWTEAKTLTVPGDARPLTVECASGCEEDCFPVYNASGAYICICSGNEPNDIDDYDYQPYGHNQTRPPLIELNP